MSLGLEILRQQAARLTEAHLAPFLIGGEAAAEIFTRDEARLLLVSSSATAATIPTKTDLAELLGRSTIGCQHLILPASFVDKMAAADLQTGGEQKAVLAVRRPQLTKLREELASLEVSLKWEMAASVRQMALLRELDNNNQEEEEAEEERLEKTMLLLVEGSEGRLENIGTELLLKILEPDSDLVAQLEALA